MREIKMMVDESKREKDVVIDQKTEDAVKALLKAFEKGKVNCYSPEMMAVAKRFGVSLVETLHDFQPDGIPINNSNLAGR